MIGAVVDGVTIVDGIDDVVGGEVEVDAEAGGTGGVVEVVDCTS